MAIVTDSVPGAATQRLGIMSDLHESAFIGGQISSSSTGPGNSRVDDAANL
jgi:hypothetical protein